MNKFGFVFFGAAALVLIGHLTNPALISSTFLGLAFVLVVMGGIATFSQSYMKLLVPGLRDATERLQSHLVRIGVDSSIIDPKGPEAVRHRQPILSRDPFTGTPWGVVKVRGRNVEFVELRAAIIPGAGGEARVDAAGIKLVYALRGTIQNEQDYQASTYVPGTSEVGWTGGRLAQILSSDSELKTMITNASLVDIRVRGIRSESYVAITRETLRATPGTIVPTYGLGDYPDINEFNVYDRIAGHVRKMLGTQ